MLLSAHLSPPILAPFKMYLNHANDYNSFPKLEILESHYVEVDHIIWIFIQTRIFLLVKQAFNKYSSQRRMYLYTRLIFLLFRLIGHWIWKTDIFSGPFLLINFLVISSLEYFRPNQSPCFSHESFCVSAKIIVEVIFLNPKSDYIVALFKILCCLLSASQDKIETIK